MNILVIMNMVSPYVKESKITYNDFNSLFSMLSDSERDEISNILFEHGIVVEKTDEAIYCSMAQDYVIDGYLFYEDFDKIYEKYPLRKQYEIVEILFSAGIELRDQFEESIVIESMDLESLVDPKNISSEEKANDEFKVLYDESVFTDKHTTSNELYDGNNITQSNTILCKLIQEGNRKAKADICVKNQRLVLKYASAYLDYYGNDCSIEDLTQMGYIGLLKAAEKFDLTKESAFSTYATYWIKQEISRGLMEEGYCIRLPAHVFESIIKITKLDIDLSYQEKDYKHRLQLIAEKLQMPLEDIKRYIEVKEQFLNYKSLNSPVGEDSETELQSYIVDDNEVPIEDQVEQNALYDELMTHINRLSPKERQVILYRYGSVDDKEHTLEEIGSMFSVTRERIRQIEQKALRKLRYPLFVGGRNSYFEDYIRRIKNEHKRKNK